MLDEKRQLILSVGTPLLPKTVASFDSMHHTLCCSQSAMEVTDLITWEGGSRSFDGSPWTLLQYEEMIVYLIMTIQVTR